MATGRVALPDDWEEVMRDGELTYRHKPTSTVTAHFPGEECIRVCRELYFAQMCVAPYMAPSSEPAQPRPPKPARIPPPPTRPAPRRGLVDDSLRKVPLPAKKIREDQRLKVHRQFVLTHNGRTPICVQFSESLLSDRRGRVRVSGNRYGECNITNWNFGEFWIRRRADAPDELKLRFRYKKETDFMLERTYNWTVPPDASRDAVAGYFTNPVCKLFPTPVCESTFLWFAREQDQEFIDDAVSDLDGESSAASWTLEDQSSIHSYVADEA